jgi:hypothetical protein
MYETALREVSPEYIYPACGEITADADGLSISLRVVL